MKKTILTLIVAAASSVAFAQTTTTTTTTSSTSTTVGTGTITEFSPGSSIVVREQSGPVSYRYGESVTYVTKDGRTLTADEATSRLRVGAPVSVTYSGTGEERVVERVVIDEVVEQR